MNIEKNISDLLYRYQCVTVPGFGAFLTELKSAQIDSNNVMQPPKKVLTFNPHLVNNDGLLANHIAVEEKISYSEAIVHLKNEVNEWKLKLEQNEIIKLHNIGEITLNSERNLLFTPSDNVNYDADSFGLTNIVAPEIAREEAEVVEKIEEPIITPVSKVDFSNISSNNTSNFEPISNTNSEEKNTKQPKNSKKTAGIFKIAAVITLLAGAGLFGFKYFNDNKVEEENLLVQQKVKEEVDQKIEEATFVMNDAVPAVDINVKEEPVAVLTQENIISNPETTKVVEKKKEEKKVEPKVETKVKTNIETPSNSQINTPYHIIAGSFKSNENASNKVKDLKNKGFKNARIVGKNSQDLFIVAYNSYSDINNAKADLKGIQQSDNDQAWILTK